MTTEEMPLRRRSSSPETVEAVEPEGIIDAELKSTEADLEGKIAEEGKAYDALSKDEKKVVEEFLTEF